MLQYLLALAQFKIQRKRRFSMFPFFLQCLSLRNSFSGLLGAH